MKSGNTAKNSAAVKILNKIGSEIQVVGIGASAGGLEALELFFKNMPENTGLAFVVIQHLDPNHNGIMPELLQRVTSMKVLQASDRLKVKSDNVYVIPPNKSLSLVRDELHLFDPVEARGLRLPIDIFFKSLATDRQEKSIGIILSGMGSDGKLGIIAIKEKNGIVLVQDPSSAKFDGMPRSALEAVVPDVVAHAEELPARLLDILEIPAKIFQKTKKKIIKKSLGESDLDKVVILLRQHSGHDFSFYKKNTLLRRIERRKEVHQIEKVHDYVRFLQGNPVEVEILFKELLIGVTSFFRDVEVWNILKEKIFPELFRTLPDGYIIRIWIPGCSTGEEAYSWAIIFKEAQEKILPEKNFTLQIFATDLDHDAIESARKGHYSFKISEDVSGERLNRFFTADGEGYVINNFIREMIVFAEQDVIRDPPFTKLNILSCRNLLIYLQQELQRKLLSLFYYSLNHGGILLLGTAETIGNLREGFDELSSKNKIYKKSAVIQANEILDFPDTIHDKKTNEIEKKMPSEAVENIQTSVDQIVLQNYSAPTVLVNEKGDILYITGHIGRYIEPAAGKANWNIYAMASEGFRQELPGAFRKVIQNHEPVVLRNTKIVSGDSSHYVDITIQKIKSHGPINGMIIIVFKEVAEPHIPLKIKSAIIKGDTNSKLRVLEEELKRSYEELKSTREEMQTSQEELKSTNEELQSTNEELQSTNEELTTSKEEMQSMNEELQTLNSELHGKVSDLLRVNNDMKNLLDSTEIATLFLDKDLNIRRFTEPLTKIFKIRNSDIGRPFTDLVNDLQYPEIEKHTLKVIKTLTTVETSIKTNAGSWYNIRIMPYRTYDDRIDGLVITFSDITVSKNLEMELTRANEGLRSGK